MKRLRNLIGIFLMMAVIMGCLSTANASDANKTKKIFMKPNKWYSADRYQESYSYWPTPIMKLTVPADGYVAVTFRQTEPGFVGSRLHLTHNIKNNALNFNEGLYETVVEADRDKDTVFYRAVSKGTYYITTTHQGKFKYKFVEQKKVTNTTQKKAKSLKQGKWLTVAHTKKFSQDRWYKFKLSKKKAITLFTEDTTILNPYSAGVDIFQTSKNGSLTGISSKFKLSADRQKYTSGKLPKGTYYIKIHYIIGSKQKVGQLTRLMWK